MTATHYVVALARIANGDIRDPTTFARAVLDGTTLEVAQALDSAPPAPAEDAEDMHAWAARYDARQAVMAAAFAVEDAEQAVGAAFDADGHVGIALRVRGAARDALCVAVNAYRAAGDALVPVGEAP